ncbi:MAG TPA: aldolase/citrate lyase family protein [Paludibacter sp.]|nr:aldolase/citrate lyase family protein [Paludibacter sp.]
MLKSFFFVPANNLKFIEKSKVLLADYIVFDLEDAILGNELEACFQNLSSMELVSNHIVRFRFFDENENLNQTDFEKLLKIGFRQFIIPKFGGVAQAKTIKTFLEKQRSKIEVSFILLLENPTGLLSIYETLNMGLISITALGLGSHDYCNAMGMKHTNSNLYFARQMVLNHAKAFNLLALDTVSVNIGYDDEFKEDSLIAFNMGFDGKFVIHPQQLKLLSEIEYYTEKEVEEAEKVYEKILEIKALKTAVVRIDGKVFEKPHINRIIKIINWKKNYGSK